MTNLGLGLILKVYNLFVVYRKIISPAFEKQLDRYKDDNNLPSYMQVW